MDGGHFTGVCRCVKRKQSLLVLLLLLLLVHAVLFFGWAGLGRGSGVLNPFYLYHFIFLLKNSSRPYPFR